MKQDWEIKEFEDCLEKVVYTNKIQRKDFLVDGEYPIISQEQNFINGYWDNSDDLFKVKKPIIIFGDHTQVLKYVDFDFVLGADGVKILQPKNNIDPRFFFYFLQNINLGSLGYARHYRLLKEIEVFYPKSLPEQQRIVAILDDAFTKIGKAKANAEQNLKNAKELFESYLQGVFDPSTRSGQGNKGEGWEEKRLEEICFKITDGSHNPPKGIDFSEYLMISSKNINNDFIDLDSPRYLKKEDFISENKRTDVVEGDVLLTIVGTIGRVAVVTNEHKYFTLQRSVAVLKPKKDIISSRFLMFSLRNIFEELNESARGVAQKGLYLNQIRSIEISIPKLKTQQIIIEKIDYLSAETKKLEAIYNQKINDLEELKKSVLQKAFSGELRGGEPVEPKTEKKLV
jgi:type I restriction enzyme S subunit